VRQKFVPGGLEAKLRQLGTWEMAGDYQDLRVCGGSESRRRKRRHQYRKSKLSHNFAMPDCRCRHCLQPIA
jgi:hypothetical protein